MTLGADVFGNITRLDNALENLAGSLQAEQNSLEETKTQLENARTELAAPFAREEELAEKTARLKELNILLNMDEKDKTLLDDTRMRARMCLPGGLRSWHGKGGYDDQRRIEYQAL